jgi:hypothetical protein
LVEEWMLFQDLACVAYLAYLAYAEKVRWRLLPLLLLNGFLRLYSLPGHFIL